MNTEKQPRSSLLKSNIPATKTFPLLTTYPRAPHVWRRAKDISPGLAGSQLLRGSEGAGMLGDPRGVAQGGGERGGLMAEVFQIR